MSSGRLVGIDWQTASRTPQPPSPQCPSPPLACPLGGPQAPGLHWQLGLKELCESREVLRFALCFSFQPQPVPAFIISKGDRALMAGSWLGLRLLALQLWGTLSK